MKTKLYFVILPLIIFQSCVYETHHGSDGRDGESFFKINWEDEEPSAVYTDGVIPTNFYWDTYYRTDPGFYIIGYEYQYFTSHGTVIYPYEVEIEIYNFEGEPGDYNYDGKDGDDVYFELVLIGDSYDFYEEIEYKSEKLPVTVTERTEISKKETIKNGKRFVTTFYKLPIKQ